MNRLRLRLARWLARLRLELGLPGEAVAWLDYERVPILLGVSSRMEYHTRLHACQKEPETIEWMDRFSPGDILYDIGANVGAYSLVAAKRHGTQIRVVAVEPATANFAALIRNLIRNHAEGQVIPLPVALSDHTAVETLHYENLTPGGALHALGGDSFDFRPVASLPVLTYALDDLIERFHLPRPTHLKIDVDGHELAILRGALRTLKSARSVLIELDHRHPDVDSIQALLASHSFEQKGLFPYRYAQRHPQFAGFSNALFVRKAPLATSDLVPPKPHLLSIERRSHPDETREGMELMDKNERTSDFPPEMMEALRGLLKPFTLRAYPEPEALYRRLVDWLGVPRSQMLLSAGADAGIRLVFDAFVQPSDEVVCLVPSYGMYPVYCGIAGAVCREVRFREDLTVRLEDVLEQVRDRTKLVLLANPNQPIERTWSDSELEALLDACRRHQALLVMDEAYHHFCPSTALSWVEKSAHLVVVRSFSKAFGIAGLRVGYLVSHPQNIRHLDRVRPLYETNSFAIAAASYLLEHEEWMRSYIEETQEAMDFLKERFKGLGLKSLGQWTNAVGVELPPALPAREIAGELKRRGFLVRWETEAPLSNHLRVTCGSKAQAERFWKAFKEVLAPARSLDG